MKLILLGTTGYHSNDRRQTACMMLPESGVLLDAGSAIYRAVEYLETTTLDIFLTHAHLDHCLGLTFMFDLRAKRPELDRITVFGEPEKLAAIDKHLFSELVFPIHPPLDKQPIPKEAQFSDGGRLTHFPLQHPGGSIGFRIEWPDRSMAYVTDTVASPEADYVDLIGGVDVLVHEAYFGDDQQERAELTGHSCVSEVARVAASANVGRLVLVHINPLLDDDD
ncbi:MAG: MBL fold metallo-hydrolase, partial [Planctomycetota bacterium]